MRVILYSAALFCATINLVGCDNAAAPTKSQTAASTAQPTPYAGKTYALGVHTSYAPFSYLDEKGRPMGFDIDILNAIAADQKINFEQIPGVHNTHYTQVLADKEQIAGAGLTYNEERAQIYALPDAYRTTKNILVYTRSDLNLTALKDLAGLRAGVISRASSQEKHIKAANVAVKEIIYYNTPYLAIQALLLNHIDVAVLNGDVATPILKNLPNQKFMTSPYAVNGKVGQDLVFIINKSEIELLQKINTGLKNIRANGSYNKISEKWFGKEAPITSDNAESTTQLSIDAAKN